MTGGKDRIRDLYNSVAVNISEDAGCGGLTAVVGDEHSRPLTAVTYRSLGFCLHRLQINLEKQVGRIPCFRKCCILRPVYMPGGMIHSHGLIVVALCRNGHDCLVHSRVEIKTAKFRYGEAHRHAVSVALQVYCKCLHCVWDALPVVHVRKRDSSALKIQHIAGFKIDFAYALRPIAAVLQDGEHFVPTVVIFHIENIESTVLCEIGIEKVLLRCFPGDHIVKSHPEKVIMPRIPVNVSVMIGSSSNEA